MHFDLLPFSIRFIFSIKNESSVVNHEDGVPLVFFIVVILKLLLY